VSHLHSTSRPNRAEQGPSAKADSRKYGIHATNPTIALSPVHLVTSMFQVVKRD
jgi:hypothetical protein